MRSHGKPTLCGEDMYTQTIWSEVAELPEATVRDVTWSTSQVICCQAKLDVAFAWIAPVYWSDKGWVALPAPCPKCRSRHTPKTLEFTAASYQPTPEELADNWPATPGSPTRGKTCSTSGRMGEADDSGTGEQQQMHAGETV